MNARPSLIVFDLYGTLIRYNVMHHPYRKILKWAKENGRKPREDDARRIMTMDFDPEIVFAQMGIMVPQQLLNQFYQDIQDELNNLTLFDDVIPVLDRLVNEGVQIAICSNLARPYSEVIDRLLPQYNVIRCLSYEIGAIKPEAAIYDDIVKQSAVKPQNILFVGDTRLADFDGPRSYGFDALHLVRGKPSESETIGSLTDLFKMVQL